MQTRLIGDAVYFTRAQLEATNPSRREGVDAVAEARWRSTTSKIVKTAIKTLKLPDWVYETAMNYINRFFLTRSIGKNDRHLVVGGAILLASKVQESPRSVQDVAYVLLQLKHANKQKPQLGPDQTALEQFMEGVVLAEQAMLFSMNFNLNVETHVSLARRLLEPLDMWAKANPSPEEAEANHLKLSLYSATTIFLNDSALTNLSLQYPNSKVAVVALRMASKRIAAARYSGKEVPVALQRILTLTNDAEWLASKGLTLERAAGIESQINELYATAPAAPSAQQQQQRQQQSQAARSQPAAAAPVADSGSSAQASSLPEQHPQQPQSQVKAPEAAGASAALPDRASGGGNGSCHGATAAREEAAAALADVPQAQAGTATSSGLPAPGLQGPQTAATAAHMEEATSGGHAAPEPSCAPPQPPGSPPPAADAANRTPICKGEEQHQPTSSAAAGPSAAGTTPEHAPAQPHPRSPQQLDQSAHHPSHVQQQQQGAQQQQHPCVMHKRVSDGDECMTGEQQATSELQPAPEQQQHPHHDGNAPQTELEAQTVAELGPAVGAACPGHLGDSPNGNCSPQGLTNGNASGSGCGHAEGQPEVCSRPDALSQLTHLQQHPRQVPEGAGAGAGGLILGCAGQFAAGQQQQPQRGKRGRGDSESVEGLMVAGKGASSVEGVDGRMVVSPAFKARRLEEAGAA